MKTHSVIIRLLPVLVVSLLLVFGCGRTGPKSVTVTGDVTYRGKTVEDAVVVFISAKNRPVDGKTNSQGRFEMKAFVSDDAANSDEHVVCVTKTVPNPNAPPNVPSLSKLFILPSRYSTPVQSPLRAAVTAQGPNEFHLELTD